ncbi:MAG: MMPL family transporter [Euryarchaeota archaeon]|jgi:predicted RND superfamily exporter protein|nr:MMPL family transporter [Euryarchaeota archaeon]MBT4793826.1 MMPL family transporter [Euryarchaeota archaeon]MBT5638948.1 MMPL family transporter [Euryarchaeota archaeon]MBT6072180.1 MMPL family transporter [Euryarchaeota archaeon]MBT6775385.1 MMPL family transporter [Euryarchaeota archaeon]
MRDFKKVAGVLIPQRKNVHLAVLIISLLMLPGFAATLTPIDVESYNLESPELEAAEVMREEFSGAGNIWGFGLFIRDSQYFGDSPSQISQVDSFTGINSGQSEPLGGILNLSVLREIDMKAEFLEQHEISEYYLSFASEISGQPILGVLDLATEFRVFMSGQSLLTKPQFNPDTFRMEEAPTNWNDCGALECLSFDDPNVTQEHIDLASHRMANNSKGAFLRFLSIDRAFIQDNSSTLIGPIGGVLDENGSIETDSWGYGRWSASSAWLILNLDRERMQNEGWTFTWINASAEWGYDREGVELSTNPIRYSIDECREKEERGEPLCSVEWLYLSIEEDLREQDELVVTILLGEGPNVEINRELLSSAYLIVLMSIVVIALLWLSLRRISDVLIVGVGLFLSLLWMQGLIGWGIKFGQAYGFEIIFRSQFSNLLPILILALGIDDSLHALHRYKEERKKGKTIKKSAEESISRVGRAILLTSSTTIVAFLANLTSDIAALRSFGIEAGLGVAAALLLTGLWVPLVRLDVDLWLLKKDKLIEEKEGQLHLIPKEWLVNITSNSTKKGITVGIVAILITLAATPLMLSLEGDFQIDDFLDDESDFAQGVYLVNERFTDGEPGYILVEGDIANPKVIEAIGLTRENMNSHNRSIDPDQISRTPSGEVELIALDEILMFVQAAMYENITPFEEAGWDSSKDDGGLECQTMSLIYPGVGIRNIPTLEDRDCLVFLYGFILTRGVPASGGYPALPPSITSEYIQSELDLDYDQPWLDTSGNTPKYVRMTMRFGLSNAEQFAKVGPALEQLVDDLSPFQNLSKTNLVERGEIETAFSSEEYPITWTIPTGDPVIRFVAADSMQNEMQSTLLLGIVFCTITLWGGFRDEETLSQRTKYIKKNKIRYSMKTIAAMTFMGGIMYFLVSIEAAIAFSLLTLVLSILWGISGFGIAVMTTTPIFLVIIWLYGMIEIAGYGLNMVTVAIAAMSLGVGIDYVIHVVERFREEQENGHDTITAIEIVGGASGLALFGSALSDIGGFLVITQSSMGFFSTFGLFCAIMIGLSLLASIILTPALIGIIHRNKISV